MVTLRLEHVDHQHALVRLRDQVARLEVALERDLAEAVAIGGDQREREHAQDGTPLAAAALVAFSAADGPAGGWFSPLAERRKAQSRGRRTGGCSSAASGCSRGERI